MLQEEEQDNLAAMDAELQQIAEKMHNNRDGWTREGGGDEEQLMWATADVTSSVCLYYLVYVKDTQKNTKKRALQKISGYICTCDI